MRYFLETFKGANVVESLDAGRKATVKAEELIFYDCGEGKEIKKFSEALPDVGVAVLSAALVVESIDLGDLSALMISSQNSDSVLVSHLQSDQQGHCLHAVMA